MADTLFHNRSQSRYPYWVNYPPTVPKYPSSQEMFRGTEPEKFTIKKGRDSHQHWTDKWYDSGDPIRREEELPKRVHLQEPCQRRWQYNPGTSAVSKWTRVGKDWPVDHSKYWTSGQPPAEVQRARGLYRLSTRDEKLYPFSNYMTSQYRRPVYSIFGPIQKKETYGLTHQHNRHGFMPFEDFY
ncbi:uncharacterized protein LOC121367817 [Gigantopelta aegis]|uniref:uncharacterized protein LOC121367817 n=1 Tax=Gigantopelta aegis TaxID=1735272 RepID=UPI001B88DF15|nr:uncharacterized protein LOC121367817 [Gigantopelta aegis]